MLTPGGAQQAAGRSYLIGSIVIVALVMTFLGFTLRHGHGWDGDYALSIMQARNLVEGTPYAATDFVPNPENAIHPALYPPGLPLLLAPVYSIKGLDLDSMKWVGLIALAAWLLLFAQIAQKLVSPWLALSAVALMGMHPYIWDIKDTIYAEFPFLLFCYAALSCAQRSIDLDRENSPRRMGFAALLALLLALTYLTRTIGIVLFPVVLVFAFYSTRRLLTATNAAVVAAILLIALVQHWLPGDASTYAGYFNQFTLYSVKTAVLDYGTATGTLLQNQGLASNALKWIAVLLFLALVATGFVARLRERPFIFELFLVAYVALLMLFPIHWEFDRYSMPVWPLLLVYGFRGAEVVGRQFASLRYQHVLPALIVVALTGTYAHAYTQTEFSPLNFSVTSPTSLELFDAIRKDVPEDAVILARKPTIIGLFTRRHSVIWPHAFTDDEFWAFVRKYKASYLVQDVYQFASGPFDPKDPLDMFVKSHRQSLRLVFHNDWFNVYALSPP